jgi:hypothetical protein
LLSLAFLFAVVTTHAIAQGTPDLCPTTGKDGISTIKKGRIESIAADQSSLQVQCNSPSDSEPITISVKKPELITTLQGFSSGDFVNLHYTAENELTRLSVAKSVVDGLLFFGVFAGTVVGLFLGTFVLVKVLFRKNLSDIFVGQDIRLSNSKSQMAIWFFVLLIGYVSLSILRAIYSDLRLIGGIGIPQNLLLLSGVSVLTYAGAKVITQSQVNSNPESKPNSTNGASLSDFVTDDNGHTDFGDLQMTMITLLAVVVYLFQLINFLGVLKLYKSVTLPDVDTTILSIFGLSQGAYLAKKAAVATGAENTVDTTGAENTVDTTGAENTVDTTGAQGSVG